MSKSITVLMIDDDKDNFDSLKNKAAYKGIHLRYAESLEEMLDELKNDLKIDAVILDGKGFRKRGQTKGSEKEDFVHEALTDLKILERDQDRVIPKCVYTAWYDQLKDSLESRVKVFDKKKLALDNNLMDEFFEYLHSEVTASSNNKIREKYKDVFTGFGGKYLPEDKEANITQILTLVESNNIIQQSDFNAIREIFEAILLRANKIDKRFIPDDLIKLDNRPNLEWCYRYLSGLDTNVMDSANNVIRKYARGNPIVSPHISRSIDYLKHISSMLSHTYSNNWTKYSFKSAGLALAEIIVWFKNYIDTQYPQL